MKQKSLIRLFGAVVLVVGLFLGWKVYSEVVRTGRTVGIVLSTGDSPPTVTMVAPDSPAQEAGLEAGDRLLIIDGHTVETTEDVLRIGRSFTRGEQIDFTIDREGRRMVVTVIPGSEFPWLATIFEVMSILGYLLIAALAVFRAPFGESSRILTYFTLAVALELALPGETFFLPYWSILRKIVYYLLSGFQMGLEFHLVSIIPTKYSWYRKRAYLPRYFYVAGLGLGSLSASVFVLHFFGHPGSALLSGWNSIILNGIVLILWGVGITIILGIQLKHSTTRANRNQTLLVLAGVIPWTAYNIVSTVLRCLSIPLPPVFNLLQPLILLLFPILIFIAIFRYHMLDVQLVLRRGLVLFLVTAIVAIFFSLIFETGATHFGTLVRSGKIQGVTFAIGMLLLGLAFNPVRKRVQDLVDRQLFPERFETRDRLAELAATLPTLGNLNDIGRHLVDEVTRIFQLENATILVADPHSGLLVSLATTLPSVSGEYGVSLLLEAHDPGIQQIKEARRVLSADIIASGSPALAQRIRQVHAEMGIGLVNGDVLVGVLLLGKPRNRERLLPEETDLINLFALNLATVLENIRLFESSRYEQLTGLLRREAILKALEEEMQRSARYFRPLTVGMIDLDFFKRINDTWGHLAGDAILQRMAQCLHAQLRTTDRIGRYGGEEFLFFLPETELNAGLHVAEKLRKAAERLDFELQDAPGLKVTVSIGLAQMEHGDSDEISVEDLIDAADQALLAAKRKGRNRVIAA